MVSMWPDTYSSSLLTMLWIYQASPPKSGLEKYSSEISQENGWTNKITSSHLRPIRASKLASVATYLPAVYSALHTTTAAHRLPQRTYKSIRGHVVKSLWQACKTKPVGGKRKYSATYTWVCRLASTTTSV